MSAFIFYTMLWMTIVVISSSTDASENGDIRKKLLPGRFGLYTFPRGGRSSSSMYRNRQLFGEYTDSQIKRSLVPYPRSGRSWKPKPMRNKPFGLKVSRYYDPYRVQRRQSSPDNSYENEENFIVLAHDDE